MLFSAPSEWRQKERRHFHTGWSFFSNDWNCDIFCTVWLIVINHRMLLCLLSSYKLAVCFQLAAEKFDFHVNIMLWLNLSQRWTLMNGWQLVRLCVLPEQKRLHSSEWTLGRARLLCTLPFRCSSNHSAACYGFICLFWQECELTRSHLISVA